MTKEDRLREIVFVEIDTALDTPYNPKQDWDVVVDLKRELEDNENRGEVYRDTKEVVVQLIHLMMSIAGGR